MPRATATRTLSLALMGGVLVDVLVPGNAPGIGMLILTVALLAAALTTAGRAGLARVDRADLWLAPIAVLLASFAAVRSEPWLVAGDLALAAATALGAIMALGGARITRGLVPAIVEASLDAMAAMAMGAIAVIGAVRPRVRPAASGPVVRSGSAAAAPVARGLLIALPLVALFAALFASADAVFAAFAGDVLGWRPDLDFGPIVERTVVVGGVAWCAAGLLALGSGAVPRILSATPDLSWDNPPSRSSLWASVPDAQPIALPRLGVVEATTVLVVLDALFATFAALQVAYLFGGRDTLAAAGISYSDYARRGFFELVAVAVGAGLMVVALDLAARRRTRPQLVASLGLLALTAVVLASAVMRLRLYQEAYGWTELRFIVLAAIAWLAVGIISTAVLLARRQTRWLLHTLGIATIVALSGMSVIGPAGFVAQRNLDRAINPALVPPDGRAGLDADYLETLGDGAVPVAVAAVGRLDPAARLAVSQLLERRAERLATDTALQGWPAWNLDRQQAREALAAWQKTSAASR